jgi:hypothetical protein
VSLGALHESLRQEPLQLQGDVGPAHAEGGRDAVLGRVPGPDVPRREFVDGKLFQIGDDGFSDGLAIG